MSKCLVCEQTTLIDGICIECSDKALISYPKLRNKINKIYQLVSYLNPKTEEEQDIVKEIMEICENT